jgi:hypothetical protein
MTLINSFSLTLVMALAALATHCTEPYQQSIWMSRVELSGDVLWRVEYQNIA